MKKFCIIILSCLCFILVSSAFAGNPFQAPGNTHNSKIKESKAPHPLYIKIAQIQQKLSTKLSGIMKEIKTTGSYRPIVSLVIIAFIYGIIHAAGPGHGKAIAASFLISRGRTIYDGFLLGNFIAILHGFSGISLVLFLKFFLRKSVMSPLDDITYITKVTSYSIIFAIGIILTIKNIYSWYRDIGVNRDNYSGKYANQPASSLYMAFIIGMIPCPGTVIIMLFAISLNMTGTGIILAVAQTLGMAVTISTIGMIVVAGKNRTLDTLDFKHRNIAEKIERILETTASTFIATIGALLLFNIIK